MSDEQYAAYEKLHDEYKEQFAAIERKSAEDPDNWELIMKCGDEIEQLRDDFNAKHDALDAQYKKPLRNLRNLWNRRKR
jgi:hypothetical protein